MAASVQQARLPEADKQAEAFGRTRSDHRSEIAEDYVELIADLIDATGEARAVDLANRLGVTNATVNNAITRLQRDGLVHSEPYRSIFLTRTGATSPSIAAAATASSTASCAPWASTRTWRGSMPKASSIMSATRLWRPSIACCASGTATVKAAERRRACGAIAFQLTLRPIGSRVKTHTVEIDAASACSTVRQPGAR